MKNELNTGAERGREDESNHERNKRIKGERDRRLRKALRHPRYSDEGGPSWGK